ncbi:MAG: hypothetical protein A2589_02420 [Candidatus Vogelbacteria bacterium RIFOXYD1_FULL_46_19]|uniref:NAD-dependent epimerase/dehydratase domain-containing protein n=1 Tax=Candidatus Vogelbacteria bacterium RIFOXYD1_FULL_46_19 TaxID=1802439 RepID=A0A1G2QGQ5_9BACT|nr:MAG: hypothetical protein A2589_02420 [Candidatus Vogelbacteria bacterium RIFOXYD1_FULL_46_19]
MKVLVTGGAGFIGSHLTDKLCDLGHSVQVLDNLVGGKVGNVNKKAVLHQVDICNLGAILPLFEGVDYVFHLAALPRVAYSIEHPAESNETNVTGTVNVLIAAKEAKVKKVIYSASSSAYGDQPVLPLEESMPANPKSPYGLQKYIGEMYARVFNNVYGLPTVCLRYFNVYGPRYSAEGAYALVIGKFLEQRHRGEPMTITGDGSQSRDFTHVYDVVRANILAMEKTEVAGGEVFNIGSGCNMTIKEIAELVGGPVEYVPARLEPKDTLADNSKAKTYLDWQPTISIEEGIKELKKLRETA